MEAFAVAAGRLTSLKTVVAVSVIIFVLASVTPTHGIRCYQCGQYTDGVGSITPCINYTEVLHLKECPQNKKQCVKYVSEGVTVRDCEAKCVEKETWGTKVYCCEEDGCNSTTKLGVSSLTLLSCLVAIQLRKLLF